MQTVAACRGALTGLMTEIIEGPHPRPHPGSGAGADARSEARRRGPDGSPPRVREVMPALWTEVLHDNDSDSIARGSTRGTPRGPSFACRLESGPPVELVGAPCARDEAPHRVRERLDRHRVAQRDRAGRADVRAPSRCAASSSARISGSGIVLAVSSIISNSPAMPRIGKRWPPPRGRRQGSSAPAGISRVGA